MERPDFRQMNEQIAGLLKLDAATLDMFEQTQKFKEEAVSSCARWKIRQAAPGLGSIPVEELKNSRAGIRIALLKDAGYQSLYDLWKADNTQLASVPGIGQKQVTSIRMVLDQMTAELAAGESIRLPQEREDPETESLIRVLARYRLAEQVCNDSHSACEKHHSFLTEIIQKIRIRSRLRWLFSGTAAKKESTDAWRKLQAYCESSAFARIQRFYALYLEAVSISDEDAFSDYERNSASYYVLLEKLIPAQEHEEKIYGSIPAQLASQISKEELMLDGFRGDLRGYQRFGVQYILHQQHVLLGDEMGLGKTIEAIAVMVHLKNAGAPDDVRFLVICPASVMVNWYREITRFSDIQACLLYGEDLEKNFDAWGRSGGAAVTNYESLKHITDRIDNHLRMDLLVIDEAHYIKNPDAKRTQYVRKLDDESRNILLMTGTPLENKVDEMCELIHFVRPDLTDAIRSYAGLRRSDEFRELLSPVYLRRKAEQVLQELPDLIEQDAWCSMTDSDREAYAGAVKSGSFMAMRRVSFLQENMEQSSKVIRLLELCTAAREDGKKTVIYSYFRETLRCVRRVLQDAVCGEITGSTDPLERQEIIDRFREAPGGSVLLCQVQAGGMGLNIQTASVVIFCEPQIKPSLERQAVARVYRMGQIRNVLLYHLMCEGTLDEAIRMVLAEKKNEFSQYAEDSVMAEAEASLADQDWIRRVVEEQRVRYLPAVRDDSVI